MIGDMLGSSLHNAGLAFEVVRHLNLEVAAQVRTLNRASNIAKHGVQRGGRKATAAMATTAAAEENAKNGAEVQAKQGDAKRRKVVLEAAKKVAEETEAQGKLAAEDAEALGKAMAQAEAQADVKAKAKQAADEAEAQGKLGVAKAEREALVKQKRDARDLVYEEAIVQAQ
jgi:hypothetical protein